MLVHFFQLVGFENFNCIEDFQHSNYWKQGSKRTAALQLLQANNNRKSPLHCYNIQRHHSNRKQKFTYLYWKQKIFHDRINNKHNHGGR